MSQNKVSREIFVPERGEVTRKWRILYNEGLCYMYLSPNIIRVVKSGIMIWAGLVEHVGGRRGAYRVLDGKPEG
jgi:hypothetical protein